MISARDLEKKLTGFTREYDYTWANRPYLGTLAGTTEKMTETFESLTDYWHEEIDFEIPGVGRIEKVEDFGGEGQGDQAWFVLRVTDEDGFVQYFRADGYYSSFGDGGRIDSDLYEVQPKQKTVTYYA